MKTVEQIQAKAKVAKLKAKLRRQLRRDNDVEFYSDMDLGEFLIAQRNSVSAKRIRLVDASLDREIAEIEFETEAYKQALNAAAEATKK